MTKFSTKTVRKPWFQYQIHHPSEHTSAALQHQLKSEEFFQCCSNIPWQHKPCIHLLIFYPIAHTASLYNQKHSHLPAWSTEEATNRLIASKSKVLIYKRFILPKKTLISTRISYTLLVNRNSGHCTSIKFPQLLGIISKSISLKGNSPSIESKKVSYKMIFYNVLLFSATPVADIVLFTQTLGNFIPKWGKYRGVHLSNFWILISRVVNKISTA